MIFVFYHGRRIFPRDFGRAEYIRLDFTVRTDRRHIESRVNEREKHTRGFPLATDRDVVVKEHQAPPVWSVSFNQARIDDQTDLGSETVLTYDVHLLVIFT